MSAVFIALCHTPEFRQNNNIFLCVRQGARFGLFLHVCEKTKGRRIELEKIENTLDKITLHEYL